ncbi:MAG: hypothetical protein KDA57_08540 [Planctomycetales bacterium]|nr:hypothetical protein [Planctomycetales bacterium]
MSFDSEDFLSHYNSYKKGRRFIFVPEDTRLSGLTSGVLGFRICGAYLYDTSSEAKLSRLLRFDNLSSLVLRGSRDSTQELEEPVVAIISKLPLRSLAIVGYKVRPEVLDLLGSNLQLAAFQLVSFEDVPLDLGFLKSFPQLETLDLTGYTLVDSATEAPTKIIFLRIAGCVGSGTLDFTSRFPDLAAVEFESSRVSMTALRNLGSLDSLNHLVMFNCSYDEYGSMLTDQLQALAKHGVVVEGDYSYVEETEGGPGP